MNLRADGFDGSDSLRAERERMLVYGDLFGATEFLAGLTLDRYALDGATPRTIHICPYPGVDARTRIRGDAVAAGIWPPRGGPDWLTTMQSTIFVPAKFSPLN